MVGGHCRDDSGPVCRPPNPKCCLPQPPRDPLKRLHFKGAHPPRPQHGGELLRVRHALHQLLAHKGTESEPRHLGAVHPVRRRHLSGRRRGRPGE
eukprot:9491130-Pyramimonas_sp.AAC.2